MLLATEKGYLYSLGKDGRAGIVFTDPKNERLMGLYRYGDELYVGAKSAIYRMKHDELTAFRTNLDAQFHKINILDNKLYATCTGFNEIWQLSLNMELENKYKITPPAAGKNHINTVERYNNRFYINLNWFEKQFGESGVAVFDDKFNEISRSKYGWQSHSFKIVDGKRHVLVGSSKALGRKINHPHKSGLLVEHDLVFELDPDKYFLKDFVYDDHYFYIGGGHIKSRENRRWDVGIIIVLSRDFSDHEIVEIGQIGGISGIWIDI